MCVLFLTVIETRTTSTMNTVTSDEMTIAFKRTVRARGVA